MTITSPNTPPPYSGVQRDAGKDSETTHAAGRRAVVTGRIKKFDTKRL